MAGDGDGDGDGDGAGTGAARTRAAFSEKLMRDLTAHRTAALQAALMQNPYVADDAIAQEKVPLPLARLLQARSIVRISCASGSTSRSVCDAAAGLHRQF